MKPNENPIAARVEAMQGRRLPAEWRKNTENAGGTYDRRDLENMWRQPQWTGKPLSGTENMIQAARLKQPSWHDLFGNQ
jgi:hypothetical protein